MRIQKILKSKTTIGGLLFMFVVGCVSCGTKTKESVFPTSDKFSLLWEITGNGLTAPSYLYGTIHMYDPAVVKIPAEVFKAIDTCKNFALEVDMNEMQDPSLAASLTINNPDSTLNKLLTPEVYAEMMQAPMLQMLASQAGNDAINKMKPIFLSTFLMIDNPMAVKTVEVDLSNYARSHEKNVFGLETVKEQFDAIDKMPLAEQAKGITEMYDYAKKENITMAQAGKNMLAKMVEAYKNQDTESFEKLEREFSMTSSTSFDSVLIAKRNVNMADRIAAFIGKGESLFTGVGTLHLPDYKGNKGVVTLLKEKGYELRPILINLSAVGATATK